MDDKANINLNCKESTFSSIATSQSEDEYDEMIDNDIGDENSKANIESIIETDTASLASISYKTADSDLECDSDMENVVIRDNVQNNSYLLMNKVDLSKSDNLTFENNQKHDFDNKKMQQEIFQYSDKEIFDEDDDNDVKFVGQIDSESGSLISDPEQILKFFVKMSQSTTNSTTISTEMEKFPIPMSGDGNVSMVTIDSSSEEIKINEESNLIKTQIVEEKDQNLNESNSNLPSSVAAVEFVDDEDSTQYEDIANEPHIIISKHINTKAASVLDNKSKLSDMDTDDDEFIEETWTERLWGLTEMFPESYVSCFTNTVKGIASATNYTISKSKCALWVTVSALVVVAFPVVLGIETIRMDETQLAQQRQMLVNSGALVTQPGSLEPSPIQS